MAPVCRHIAGSAVIAAFGATTAVITTATFGATTAVITAAAFRATAAMIAAATFRAAAAMITAATFGAAAAMITAAAFRAAAAMITAAAFRAAAAMITTAAFRAATAVITTAAFGAAAAVIAARAFVALLAFVAVPTSIAAMAFLIAAASFAIGAPLGPVTAAISDHDLAVLADRNRELGAPGVKLRLPHRITGNTRRRWHRQQGKCDSKRCGTWHPTHVFLPFTAGRLAGDLQGKGYDFMRIFSKQIAFFAVQKEIFPD